LGVSERTIRRRQKQAKVATTGSAVSHTLKVHKQGIIDAIQGTQTDKQADNGQNNATSATSFIDILQEQLRAKDGQILDLNERLKAEQALHARTQKEVRLLRQPEQENEKQANRRTTGRQVALVATLGLLIVGGVIGLLLFLDSRGVL